jgi:ribosomal protein S18 acetylase RimI-like enzyme
MSAKTAMNAIRPGRPDDLQRLCTLESASFSGDRLSPARLLHWLGADNGILLVAESRGEVLGYGLAIYRRDSRAGRVYSLAVDPAFRGRGLGTGLLAALEADAAGRGCTEMRLEVASHNTTALLLYTNLGYTVCGRREAYYDDGDASLRLRKPLASPD